jgi:hypothetical protein
MTGSHPAAGGASVYGKLRTVTAGIAVAAAILVVHPRLRGQDAEDEPVRPAAVPQWSAGHAIVNPPMRHDTSVALPELIKAYQMPPRPDRKRSTTAPVATPTEAAPPVTIPPESAAVEQTVQGALPPPALVASFDGLGYGFEGPQGKADGRNPSDNSLGVGPNEIVQIVNSRLAIFSKQGAKHAKTGEPLVGPVVTNTLFAGFGGPCEKQISGDAVVRYDQLADRWLFVVPIFRKSSQEPDATYGMCYAVSVSPDPMGAYYRYEFARPLFPDYPRPAIWPDGYYIPTSTGDTVIQKHICVADRRKMLAGQPADEVCEIIDGVNFLNASDVDGKRLPPAGMPDIIMADGGTQLHSIFEDDAIDAYKLKVNFEDPEKTELSGPEKIAVAPYHYLCNGQLSKCVPQPDTDVRLDSQGDKLMQRLVYRNFGSHQSIVATHSIDTRAGGGVRWYEFRVDKSGTPSLFQQGTYAPEGGYRWLPSIAMDGKGDIGLGYSWGGPTHNPGQRFTARRAGDAQGQMTLHEGVLAEGEGVQTNTLRWEDYTTLDIDPTDGCTFWYVGDYFKKGAENYSTRIGGFRVPGCGVRHKFLGMF